ncbi:unnamed protein product [Brugia pahangi]|uniref:Plasmid stabilization protein n=1 Tax=Brugia pahangi TaxID=6280 RepID=A0A0N4TJG1_BRUPA|nr:unnamed protein product [Brugia pahangi]
MNARPSAGWGQISREEAYEHSVREGRSKTSTALARRSSINTIASGNSVQAIRLRSLITTDIHDKPSQWYNR